MSSREYTANTDKIVWGTFTQFDSVTRATWAWIVKPNFTIWPSNGAVLQRRTGGTSGFTFVRNLLASQFAFYLMNGGVTFAVLDPISDDPWVSILLSYDGNLVGNSNRLQCWKDGVSVALA